MVSEIFAMGAPTGGGPAGGFLTLLPMVLIFLVLYFLMIRPQQKKQKEQKKMLQELKKGDKVVSTGGIHGVIVNLQEDIVSVKIASNVTVDISRPSISRVKN